MGTVGYRGGKFRGKPPTSDLLHLHCLPPAFLESHGLWVFHMTPGGGGLRFSIYLNVLIPKNPPSLLPTPPLPNLSVSPKCSLPLLPQGFPGKSVF